MRALSMGEPGWVATPLKYCLLLVVGAAVAAVAAVRVAMMAWKNIL